MRNGNKCIGLSLSSLFFLIPLTVFFAKHRDPFCRWTYEHIITYEDKSFTVIPRTPTFVPNSGVLTLAVLLVCNVVFSVSFWLNPIRPSIIHSLDGLFAKISAIVFSVYILFIKSLSLKMRITAFTILCLVSILRYYSHIFSRANWCSTEHVLVHALFHFFASIGCSFAFI
jgi:hypothetical protein